MSDDIYSRMRAHVVRIIGELKYSLHKDIEARINVGPPRDPAHGDMTTNAALVLATYDRAKPQNPVQAAQKLIEPLSLIPEVASVEVAGKGYVNITLHPAVLRAQLPSILRAGEAYGDSRTGAGVRVNVEYVSANPTGPLHVGHCRGAVVGDALANLLAKAGFAVTKEYYINDAGAQVAALAWAAYWRYLNIVGGPVTEAAFAEHVPGGLQYRGEYLVEVGERLAERFGNALADSHGGIAGVDQWMSVVQPFAIEVMLQKIREDLAALGVEPDVFVSERSLIDSGAVSETISRLEDRGFVYQGTLEPPKGKTPEDWEPREQTLFRATAFGDDVDRPLRKSDGSNTYFANDIAYHADKVGRGFAILIDVLGADHGGYVKRMTAAVQAISDGRTRFEAVLCQIVHVLKDGEPVRMSKRAGTYVTLRDLIDWVGRDAVRFIMLTRKADAQMEFDLDAAVAQTRENPLFYVQYAHARCRSVLRAAAEMFGADRSADAALAAVTLDHLEAEAELALLRRLAQWPRTVEAAALAREPHRIAFFLYDLAADFHMLWNRGREDAALRFLHAEQADVTLARLALVAATAIVIRSGLRVMGVAPLEELR